MTYMSIGKEYKFEAGHHLWNDDYSILENSKVFGKCTKPHGHSYTFVVEIAGPVNDGMVMNYYAIDEIADPIVEYLDHTVLNDLPAFRNVLTTAENIAEYIFSQVRDSLHDDGERVAFVNSVTVRETVKTFARVEA